MGKFSYATKNEQYKEIEALLDSLGRPYIFTVMEPMGQHTTENLCDLGDAEPEEWMQLLGGLWSIGIDVIAAKRGAAEAKAFIARTLDILNAIAEDAT